MIPASHNPAPAGDFWPLNPALVRVWRGGAVESVHRAAWCCVDTRGEVLAGQGDLERPGYARSSIKALQALPLVESGAADHFDFSPAELALAVASHNGEPGHLEVVEGLLERLGLSAEDLQCGAQVPGDSEARFALRTRGEQARTTHHYCSGKHAGFLALALHLGAKPARYLDPNTSPQVEVRRAVAEMCGMDPAELIPGIDGCSAPNYRLPLRRLAMAFARLANPQNLHSKRRAAAERILDAVAAHPRMIGGTRRSLDSTLAELTSGRLFPKYGAEAVHVLGERGGGRGMALKVDDGGLRGMHALVVKLCEELEFLTPAELEQLASWRDPILRNQAGHEVGRIEVLLDANHHDD